MKTKKLRSVRRGVSSERATRRLREVVAQRASLTKARFDLQEVCFAELSKRNRPQAESAPLPKGVRTALARFHADLKQAGGGRPSPGQMEMAQAYLDLEHYLSAAVEAVQTPFWSTFEIPGALFWAAPPDGHAEAHQIDAEKWLYCSAGAAELEGDLAQSWNTQACGFISSFTLTGTGKSHRIKISSFYRIFYSWLEALSFGSQSWGEVIGASQLDVLLEGQVYSDSLELVHGISPRGHYADDEVGVWHPDPYGEDRSHSVGFTADFPDDTQHLVTIQETISFTAMRHGRVDRCNALAQVSCAFKPVRVAISNVW